MRVNEPDVVYQSFPGEYVIINLRTGTYYSTSKVGSDIFGMIVAGITQIPECLVARWGVDFDEATRDTEAFVQALKLANLVTDADGPEPPTEAFPAPAKPYETPTLNAYEDMQELLLLDPVHDVDEQGWPNKAVKE